MNYSRLKLLQYHIKYIASKLDNEGFAVDAGNLRNAASKFFCANDLRMLEDTYDTAKMTLKFRGL